MKGYKGFGKDLKCRGFQYEVGKDYETDDAKLCERGFHFCENPLDVFKYYPPSNENGINRFCEVEGYGEVDNSSEDKRCCTKIHIGAEIGLSGIIKAGVKFILDKVDFKNAQISNTGTWSAATNTGDQSAATNTGNWSAAIVSGKESIAIVTGVDSKAKGAIGCWIVLTERDKWNGETYPIKEVKAFKVDGINILPDKFYKLINGKPVIVD